MQAGLACQAALAGATRALQRQQAALGLPHQGAKLGQFSLAADKRPGAGHLQHRSGRHLQPRCAGRHVRQALGPQRHRPGQQGAQRVGRLQAQIFLQAPCVAAVQAQCLLGPAQGLAGRECGGQRGFVAGVKLQHALGDAQAGLGCGAQAQAGCGHRVPGLVAAFVLRPQPVQQGRVGRLHQALQQITAAQGQCRVQRAGIDPRTPVAALGALPHIAGPGLAGQGAHGPLKGQQVGIDDPAQRLFVGLQRLHAGHGAGLAQHLAQIAARGGGLVPGPQQRGGAVAAQPLAVVQRQQRQQLIPTFGSKGHRALGALQRGRPPQQQARGWLHAWPGARRASGCKAGRIGRGGSRHCRRRAGRQHGVHGTAMLRAGTAFRPPGAVPAPAAVPPAPGAPAAAGRPPSAPRCQARARPPRCLAG